MWAEQAIFTSLARNGRAGYHVVAWSPGIAEADTKALAAWSPAHGALITDAANRTSVNFQALAGGRLVLSRTCEGPAEYSGRGGRQLYTHALILGRAALERSDHQPIALYRAALALGHFRYRDDPPMALKPVPLSHVYPRRDAFDWAARVRDLGMTDPERIADELTSGRSVSLTHAGDRIALVECLLALVPAAVVPTISFTTSLRPSPVRPYRIGLVA